MYYFYQSNCICYDIHYNLFTSLIIFVVQTKPASDVISHMCDASVQYTEAVRLPGI